MSVEFESPSTNIIFGLAGLKTKRVLVVRLKDGDDIVNRLEEIARDTDIKSACSLLAKKR